MKNSDQHGIATPSSMEEHMSRAHLPRLTVQPDGTVIVGTPDDLDQLSACPVHDLSTEMLTFVDREWLERTEEERASIAAFLNAAREQVCNEGRLPPPRTNLPSIGTRVEALVTSRKPGPDCRHGTGTVNGQSWDSVTRDWRLEIVFDVPAGTHYGMPIQGTSTFTDFAHVIGGSGRAWSSMTPTEIDEWVESRRR
ncbi:MAG: hypothetical protein ACLQU9_13415 [Acidimicrobiales bacterium]